MGNVFMRFPGGKKKALTLSYDDGTRQDIRLIGMMKSYGLKGTFNISSGILAPEGTVYEPGTIHQRITGEEVLQLEATCHHNDKRLMELAQTFVETD